MIKEGSKAPGFELFDKDGNTVKLGDYRGKRVVIYFYSKDGTPGCTRQAESFADFAPEFNRAGVTVIGISKDKPETHKKFSDKLGLPFTLLSDQSLATLKEYGVWREKKLYGKTGYGTVRTAFLIDGNGIVEKVFERIKPDTGARIILDYIISGE